MYIGADRGDDPNGLLYYLERVFVDSPQRSVRILSHKPSETLDLGFENMHRNWWS